MAAACSSPAVTKHCIPRRPSSRCKPGPSSISFSWPQMVIACTTLTCTRSSSCTIVATVREATRRLWLLKLLTPKKPLMSTAAEILDHTSTVWWRAMPGSVRDIWSAYKECVGQQYNVSFLAIHRVCTAAGYIIRGSGPAYYSDEHDDLVRRNGNAIFVMLQQTMRPRSTPRSRFPGPATVLCLLRWACFSWAGTSPAAQSRRDPGMRSALTRSPASTR